MTNPIYTALDEANAEIEALRKAIEIRNQREWELTSEIERLRKDAERYQEIRRIAQATPEEQDRYMTLMESVCPTTTGKVTDSLFDTAIDAASAATKGAKE